MSIRTHRERTVWWGHCDSCDAAVHVSPHPDRTDDLPRMDTWDVLVPRCYVCGGRIIWGGSDRVMDIFR